MHKAIALLSEAQLPLRTVGEDAETLSPVFELTQELDQRIIHSLKAHGYVAYRNRVLKDGQAPNFCYMKAL